jgi:UDP-3-O-[3-hydroxymyristoyl] glucosamine N-acyltransferase
MKLPSHHTLEKIAGLINAEYSGDPNFEITGINEIHRVEPGDLTFVDHPKYYDKALNSAATTVLINRKVDCPTGKSLIFSDDPFRDYNFLTRHFNPFKSSSENISSTALIGSETVVMQGAVIGNFCKIGKNCLIYPNVVIYDHTEIGDNVIIHANSVIGSDAFYFKRRPESYDKMHSCGRVIIHNNVEIGSGCTIDRGVSADTIIGKGTKLDNQVHVGHDTVIGENCLFAAQVGIAGVVNIEDNVILWGQVGVQKDLTIGKGAIVLGQSGIPKSLEAGKTYFGSPTREARDKMKEIAMLKNLEDLLAKLNARD